jgi:hypothetical protein
MNVFSKWRARVCYAVLRDANNLAMPQERDDLGLWMLESSLGLSAGGRWQFSLAKSLIHSLIMQRAEKNLYSTNFL